MAKEKSVTLLVGLLLFCPTIASYGQDTMSPLYYSTNIGYGARALAMGGAFIALADDITAMSYNPAGMAQLLKAEFSLGAKYSGQYLRTNPYTAVLEYNDPEPIEQIIDYSALKAHYTRLILDYIGGVIPFKIARMPIVVGVGFQKKGSDTARSTYYSENESNDGVWKIKSLSEYSQNDRGGISLATFSLAARPLEFLYMGFNVNLWHEDSHLYTRELDTGDTYYQDELSLTVRYAWDIYYRERILHGINYDLGVLLKFKKISAGFVFKSPFKADFYQDNRLVESLVYFIDSSDSYTGKIHWPYSYGLGLAMRPAELLTVSADYTFSNWSAGKVVYDDDLGEFGYPTESPTDTKQVRFGVEYIVFAGKFAIPLRTGCFYDQVFWTDADNKRIGFLGLTLGTGVSLKNTAIDLCAVYHSGSYKYLLATWVIGDISKSFFNNKQEADWSVLLSFSFRL